MKALRRNGLRLGGKKGGGRRSGRCWPSKTRSNGCQGERHHGEVGFVKVGGATGVKEKESTVVQGKPTKKEGGQGRWNAGSGGRLDFSSNLKTHTRGAKSRGAETSCYQSKKGDRLWTANEEN